MTLQLRYATHSEIGLVRKNNQDSGYASGNLLLVADGMGGAAAGDLASAVAVDTIAQVDAATPADQMLPVLAEAIAQANQRIAELVEADYSLDGMGTTVTGALFDGAELGLAHIGDSRAYLFRNDRLEQLTHDHSWVQSLVDDGKINEAEASVHPHRSLLLKVLNGQPTNDPDLTRIPLQDGDRLLFCSDGLCGLVDDPEIAEGLRIGDLESALRALVDAARAEGGVDNITVIVADVVDASAVAAAAASEPVVLGAAAEQRLASTEVGGIEAIKPELDAEGTVVLPAPPRTTTGGASAGHDDEARYNPQPPRRGRILRSLAWALLVVVVAAAGLGTAYAWGRTQYYVGAHAEQVAIFQGLPERVVVPLSRVFEVQPLPVADLPTFYQDQVRAGIEVSSLGAARQTVAELREASLRCAGSKPSTPPEPTSTPSPTAKAEPRSTPTPVRPEVTPSLTPSTPATADPSC